MNIYDKKIKFLIEEYLPNEEDFQDVDIVNLIGKIIEKNCKNKNFAIWGAGEHTENLHKYFSLELKDAKCIIDNNKNLIENKFLGFKVIAPKDISKYKIDVIIISSYAGRISIGQQIRRLVPNCKIIDFYEILENEGVKLRNPFYLNETIYTKLYQLRIEIENIYNKVEKQKKLKKLIFLYLKIRDFFNAKNFIKVYINENYGDSDKFNMLLKQVDEINQILSNSIRKRNGNDIFMLFFDSLRAKDVFNENTPMTCLKNILDKSVCFYNAFSPSIFTYESIPSTLTGKLPFYNDLYKRKLVNEEEVNFIKNAIDKGYDIKIYTVDYWKIVKGKDIKCGKYSNYMSKNLWNAICDLAQNKSKNTIYLLYFLQETHPPHMCGYHNIEPVEHNTPFTCDDIVEQEQYNFNMQYDDCLKYIDKQLDFYFNIMSEESIKIIFSDHGQIIEQAQNNLDEIGTLAGWHDDRFHIPLIINSKKIKAIKYDDIFSMVDFSLLISGLMNSELKIVKKDFVEIDFSKICNDVIIKKYLKENYDDYIYGFKVFRSNKYKLVITGNQKIKLYKLPYENVEINDRKLINEIIEKIGEENKLMLPKFD